MAKSRAKSLLRRLLPRKISQHQIWTGPLRGATIVTSWHDYPAAITGLTERPLLSWFAQHVSAGDTWLDVGAHYGYTAIALARLVGKTGRVFAFEPLAATAGHLAKTRALNRLDQLTVVPVALGCPTDLTLLRLPTSRGMADRTLDHADFETFMAARFDWLWPKLSEADIRVHGIKIDVQGMEIEVIRGMREVLLANRPKLVVEVHYGVSRAALTDELSAAGYPCTGIPIEAEAPETTGGYLDDHSYVFSAA